MYKLLPQHPIDLLLIDVLQQVQHATNALNLNFFVGGAMARDILLTHVFDQPINRATRDVDIGLHINTWEEFSRLKTQLVGSGYFAEDSQRSQRLIHHSKLPLDLIPFGGIASKNQSISWPPNHDIVLNVSGFEDAFKASVLVDLGHGLQVKTCSLPSLAVLKLIAWKDRGLRNNKDATDFLLIAQRYAQADNMERLYGPEAALLSQAEWDPNLAGAELLGRDAAMQCKPATAAQIIAIFADEQLRQRLTDQLLRANYSAAGIASTAQVEPFLEAFSRGFALPPLAHSEPHLA